MEKLGRLTTEDRDNLAAYLDGELDESATRRIESILSNNTVAQNDLELLARTYELLDVLPKATAPDDFTEQTVATAKQEAIRRKISDEPWFKVMQQCLVLSAWTAAMLLTATFAFAITNRWIEKPEDLLLEEYQIIKNLDTYREVDNSVEFLDKLAADRELLEEIRRTQK